MHKLIVKCHVSISSKVLSFIWLMCWVFILPLFFLQDLNLLSSASLSANYIEIQSIFSEFVEGFWIIILCLHEVIFSCEAILDNPSTSSCWESGLSGLWVNGTKEMFTVVLLIYLKGTLGPVMLTSFETDKVSGHL